MKKLLLSLALILSLASCSTPDSPIEEQPVTQTPVVTPPPVLNPNPGNNQTVTKQIVINNSVAGNYYYSVYVNNALVYSGTSNTYSWSYVKSPNNILPNWNIKCLIHNYDPSVSYSTWIDVNGYTYVTSGSNYMDKNLTFIVAY